MISANNFKFIILEILIFILNHLNTAVVIETTIIFIICWDFLIFYQIFSLPQVKRQSIFTYKHGIYNLPHELPNDLRFTILGN